MRPTVVMSIVENPQLEEVAREVEASMKRVLEGL